jgi:hypothetical protein
MSTNESLTMDELERRALDIRARYEALEKKHHGTPWTVEEDALAFMTDAALVARLTMAQQGRWPKAESAGELEHKLGECVWWLTVLARRMDLDIERATQRFLSTTEQRLGNPP